MILFIAAMIVAGLAVGVFSDQQQGVGDQGVELDAPASQAEITGVSVYGISENTARYATIEISGGSTPRNLSQLALTLNTPGGSQTLSP